MCACCGGLMLTFNKDKKPYSLDFYLVSKLPANSGINESTVFPVYVKIKYTFDTLNCGKKIAIDYLEKQ